MRVFALFVIICSLAGNSANVVQEIKMEAPSLTEEDQHSLVMPRQYQCDACKAILFHMHDAIDPQLRRSRERGGAAVKESHAVDILDSVCAVDTFKGYGVSLISGANALTGPGLTRKEALGKGMGSIQMGGDAWGRRLSAKCLEMVEDAGELDVFALFSKNEESSMCDSVCAPAKAAPKRKATTKPDSSKSGPPVMSGSEFLAIVLGEDQAEAKRSASAWHKLLANKLKTSSDRSQEL